MVTQLRADDIDHQMPGLLVGTSVVALVPATELRGWAAEMAWSIARAAAAAGRRTVLVDCFVESPTLHGAGGEGNDEGLVDAFEYGASLNRIVRQQPQADLFFIPAGTYSTDAEPLMQHPRWKRLSAGFRHEEALLLLYVGAEHLAALAAEPDGVVVLAPQGLDTGVSEAPALTEAVGKGMTLIAVVADNDAPTYRDMGEGERDTSEQGERDTADQGAWDTPVVHAESVPLDPSPDIPPAPSPDLPPSPLPRSPRLFSMLSEEQGSGFAWGTWMTIVLLLAAVSGGAWWMISKRQAAAAIEAQAIADSARAETERAQAVQPPPVPAAESLPFAVQVASLAALPAAYGVADSLVAHGTPAIIAPLRGARRRTTWRVYAGPYATRARADSVLAALRAAGAVAPTGGGVADVPLSLGIGTPMGRTEAVAERDRLRAAGMPVFILGQADGTFRLFAGAYEAGAQASLLQDLLTPTGGAGTLVPRAGYLP